MNHDCVDLESGKLITWGSAEEEAQTYLTSGKHGVIQIPFKFSGF